MNNETKEQVWDCKIGGVVGELPPGADFPIRQAVKEAFLKLTGVDAEFCFSGWGGSLDANERAVVEAAQSSAPGGVWIDAEGGAFGTVSDEQIEVVLTEALADVRKRSGLQQVEEEDISYEVIQDDQPVAGATTLQETLNYAAQYLQDGPVEIVEVRRTVINRLEKP